MRENLFDIAVETALLAVYLIGAAVTGLLGLIVEHRSLVYVLAGEYDMAAYLGFVGLVALGFAYLFVSEKLAPALAHRSRE